MNNRININMDWIPPEALEEVKQIQKELDEEFNGRIFDETTNTLLNHRLHEIEQYLNEKYGHLQQQQIQVKQQGEGAYHEETWTVEKISQVHETYYPERKHKQRYTRREVNNMLFDLTICDVLSSHEVVYSPFAVEEYDEEYDVDGDELFDDEVTVFCRYGI
jgi:hypothetical protein